MNSEEKGYYNQPINPSKYFQPSMDGINKTLTWMSKISEKMMEELRAKTGETIEQFEARLKKESEERKAKYDATYFTPTLEELFWGYECEVQTSWGYSKGVWPTVLENDTHFNLFNSKRSVSDIEHLRQYSSYLRAKYLTVEQIEQEGFVANMVGTFIINDFLKTGGGFLWYDFEKHTMKIVINKTDGDALVHGDTLFEGNCKSVNELRKLIKQLDISVQKSERS